jgi:hypothetical protein
MLIQSSDSVSFEAVDHSAEAHEARDLAQYHELLMRGGPDGRPGSEIYARLIGAATQSGPLKVIVTDSLDKEAHTIFEFDTGNTTIRVNPGFAATRKARTGSARESLLFEVGNASNREEFLSLVEAAMRNDFSEYDESLSATDARLLGSFGGDPGDQIHRNRVIYAREMERLEYKAAQLIRQINKQMIGNRLPRIGADMNNFVWRNFDECFDSLISSGHPHGYLLDYDRRRS